MSVVPRPVNQLAGELLAVSSTTALRKPGEAGDEVGRGSAVAAGAMNSAPCDALRLGRSLTRGSETSGG